MGWIIAYLVSVWLAANITSMVVIGRSGDNDKIVIHRDHDLFYANIFCLFWPITVPYHLSKVVLVNIHVHRVDTAKKMFRNHNFSSVHDRSFMLDVPEYELKYLFKAYRKKWLDMNASTAEMIREELLNRNMERNLLK